MTVATKQPQENAYQAIVAEVFFAHYEKAITEFEFNREEILHAAKKLGISPPKNVGDVLYSVRYRSALPARIQVTQPPGMTWIIEGSGRAKYKFRLVRLSKIIPNPILATIGVPDATPEIIRRYAKGDEQALLAIVRYNRLLDIFLGLTTYSLQSHLRTSLSNGVQIEIDEVYIGIDKQGAHYIIPVQAKGGNDKIAVVQTSQDLKWSAEAYPDLRCIPISAQFMPDDKVALIALKMESGEVRIEDERHYRLVASSDLDVATITNYR